MSTPQPLAAPAEVAAYLGRSVQALAQMRHHGTGPAYLKTGRLIRYRWADVDAWLEQTRSTQTAPEAPAGAAR